MKNKKQEPLFYTIKEFSKLFRISKSIAYQIARTNGFPQKRIGKRILIPADELYMWMKKNCDG